MALYEVTRTDTVKPGEFDSAYVIAGGTAIARKMLASHTGVEKDGKNLKATKVDVSKASMVITTYFDERVSD
jgi:hypothetical protein